MEKPGAPRQKVDTSAAYESMIEAAIEWREVFDKAASYGDSEEEVETFRRWLEQEHPSIDECLKTPMEEKPTGKSTNSTHKPKQP
jgi:dsDNA-binding SOS-regulon protein